MEAQVSAVGEVSPEPLTPVSQAAQTCIGARTILDILEMLSCGVQRIRV